MNFTPLALLALAATADLISAYPGQLRARPASASLVDRGSAPPSTDIVIPLNSESGGGYAYTVDITVDGVRLPAKLDTSASQLWVAHNTCAQCQWANMIPIASELPENCFEVGVQQNISYMQGWVAGCIVTAEVQLGDNHLAEHHILAIMSASEDTSQVGFYSASLGLAGDNEKLNGGPTLISAMYQGGLTPSGVVGFYLPRNEQVIGEIRIGNPANSTYTDTSKCVKLDSVDDPDFQNGYIVEFDSFKVGQQEIANKSRTFLNTASSGISFPASLKEAVFANLNWEPSDTDSGHAPCTSTIADPTLRITFGGVEFEVIYEDLVAFPDSNGRCKAMITPSVGVFSETWIIGDAFFHNVYHSVDTQTGEIQIFGLRE